LPPGNRQQCGEKAACITCRLFGFVHGKSGYRGRVVFSEFSPCGETKLDFSELPPLEQPFKDYPRIRENKGCGNERLYYCQFYNVVDCGGPTYCLDCTKEEWLHWRRGLNNRLPLPVFRGRKFYLRGDPRLGNQPHEVISPGSRFQGEVTFYNLDQEELALLCFALGLDGEIRLGLGYGKPAYYGTVRIELKEIRWYTREYLYMNGTESDPVELACSYGRNDPDIARNVAMLREVLSDRRRGPAWGIEGY
jgi:hypothetical protein